MSCLPKPVLRGHTKRYGIRLVIGAVTFGVVNGALFHFFVAVPRAKRFEEFYKTYDPIAHYKRLCDCGYLQSCK